MILPLIILDFVFITTAFGMIFFYAPVETTMGITQKIFYIHLPSALAGLISTFILFVGSAKYLLRPSRRTDCFAHAAAEIAWLFCTVALITGIFWARQAWSVWWAWDPRLTSFLVLWCILSLYHVLRRSLPAGLLQYRLAAVFGIIGFIDVPLVFLSIYWWRSLHPAIVTSRGIQIDAPMLRTLMVASIAILGLMAILITFRTRLLDMESRLAGLVSKAGESKDPFVGRNK